MEDSKHIEVSEGRCELGEDPVAIEAAAFVMKRSRQGAIEYGNRSVLDGRTPLQLLDDMVEEVADMLIYAVALRQVLTTPRGGEDV